MIEQLIYDGDLNGLKRLLESKGIDAVTNNKDPNELASIHIAAQLGNKEIVEFLIKEPIRENSSLTRINNFTPLHAASMNGHNEIVKYLIQCGAKVNEQTDPQGYTPLHSAAFGGHLETVRTLVESGGNVTLRNYRNEMPIDTAKRQNQIEVENYLKNK